MRAARRTLFFGTRSTRFAAFLHASRVATLNVADLIAKRACFTTVAGSSARVLAIGKIAPALLPAFAVSLFDDIWTLAQTALTTLVLASVTARLQGTTSGGTDVNRSVKVEKTWQ